MSETNLYSENLLDCSVRRSIVHSSPAKTSPKPQIIFNTSVASMLPTMAGVTPHHSFGRRRHPLHFFFIGIKIPVVFLLISVVEYRNLSFKTADSTIYVGLFLFNANVVNQVAGGKVVAAIHHYIIFLNDIIRIVFRQPGSVGVYFDFTVESGEPFRSTDSFWFT